MTLFHPADNGARELIRRRAPTKVAGHVRAVGVHLFDSPPQSCSRLVLAQMCQHHDGGEHERSRIGDALCRRCPARCHAPLRRPHSSRPCWLQGQLRGRPPGPQPGPTRCRRTDSEAAGCRRSPAASQAASKRCRQSAPGIRFPGTPGPTSRQHRRNRPSASFMMLALWTAVTFLRPCLRA